MRRMNKLIEEIEKAQSIGICGHVRPDGDCLGSVTAMYNYIRVNYPEKSTVAFLESVPEKFRLLKGSDEIITDFDSESEREFDLFICLDSGDPGRIGDCVKFLDRSKFTICIDHHISNKGYCRFNHIVPEASSACEVIFELFDYDKINTDIATCLYMGILHDTGVFKHSNVSGRTFEVAGLLINKGVPFTQITEESFYEKTYTQNQILGRCLLESIMCLDGKCIVSRVSQKMMKFYGADASDLDGIIDQLRITKGVEVAILIHETAEQEYKVSLRSNGIVDVNKIAVFFGGGGHKMAAGCKMNGAVHDVINNLTMHIEQQLV